ncbi:MAG: hypothetical protein FJ280_07790, partial [Planctomycetes bacterium]|nr:hypothetical protein [Planctomycetota bacterium]
MKRRKCVVTKAVVLLVNSLLLLPARGNAGVSTGSQQNYRRPALTAPMLKQAPVVDGKVDRSEWQGAAQGLPLMDRFSGAMPEEKGVFQIGHDAAAPYVAFRLERPPYARQPGAEDRIEFFVHPESNGPDFTFILYPDGRKLEGLRTASADLGWECPWDGAVRVTETGWEGELRIPFTSLDRKSAPAAASTCIVTAVSKRSSTGSRRWGLMSSIASKLRPWGT